MVETYYKVLTGENLDVFGTGKSAASNNIAHDPADELLFFNSLGSDYRLAAGDVLAISIRGLSSTDEEAVVDGEGKIAISGMLPSLRQGVPSRMCKVTLSKSWKSMMRLPTCMSALQRRGWYRCKLPAL